MLVAFGAAVTVVVRESKLAELSRPDATFTSDLDAALGRCDFLTLHVPLTPETRGLIGRRELGLMRPDSFVVNTSRGELIDQAALLDALDAGTIAGAGLDVAAQEPPAPDDPIRNHPRVLLTPHNAAGTREALEAKATAIFSDLQRVWSGLAPLHPVTT